VSSVASVDTPREDDTATPDTTGPATSDEDPELEARAERLRADYLADVTSAPRCGCDRPLLELDDDGDAHCARCGRAAT
jgi:hypothetical protein